MPEHESTERTRDRIGFLGLGIMGSRMAANLARAGFAADRLDAHARQGRALGRRARRARLRDPRRGRRAAATSSSAWSSTASRSPRCCSASDGVLEAARAGAAVRRHVHDRPRRHAAHRRRAWPSAAWRMLDAPVTGSSPARRGRLADDHGRRRARGLRARAAAARGDGQPDRARRRARPGPDAQADQQRPRRRQRRGGRRGAAARRATGDRPRRARRGRLRRLRRLGAADAEVRRRCASTTTRPCSRPRTCSRTCACACEEAQAAGVPFPAAAHARDLLTATMGRGHAEQDYAVDDRGRRGARRPPPVDAPCAAPTSRASPIRQSAPEKPARFAGDLGFSLRFRIFNGPCGALEGDARECQVLPFPLISFVPSSMPIAFKEWAVTVRALAEGEQLITLRKGVLPQRGQAVQARPRALLPVPHLRPPARRPRARVPPARAAPRARGGRLERRRAAAAHVRLGRARCSSPTACASARGRK